MDFELTDEQRALRESIVEFARRELGDDVVSRDTKATFSRQAWQKCASMGLLGLPVPTEFGGAGADATTTIVALEALGYACTDNGLIFSLNAQMWACEVPIARFGTVTLVPALDIFNLTNANTVAAQNRNQAAANANTVSGILAPRVMRIGIAARW